MNQFGTLYIVATPIGNMADISLRAIETLRNVDLVVCEDTRVTGGLLKKYEIKKLLLSLHQHSDEKLIDQIIDRLLRGENIAYVTDGGTPSISDPGSKLIQRIREMSNVKCLISNEILNIKIIPIPGPSALTSAISVSGLIDKEFYFGGFLPKKKGRQTKFKELAQLKVPIVIYESALRLDKTLKDIDQYFGKGTEVFIAREMTKMFEEYWGGEIDFVLSDLKNHKLKGEVTMIVKGVQGGSKGYTRGSKGKYEVIQINLRETTGKQKRSREIHNSAK